MMTDQGIQTRTSSIVTVLMLLHVHREIHLMVKNTESTPIKQLTPLSRLPIDGDSSVFTEQYKFKGSVEKGR